MSIPTLANLIIVSCSIPGDVTNRIGWVKESRLPAHSANLPSNPIKTEPGTNPDENSAAGLVSKITASSFINSLNSFADKGCKLCSKIAFIVSYPCLLICALIGKYFGGRASPAVTAVTNSSFPFAFNA